MTAGISSEFLALQQALAGRYSIERELGRGGMGIVLLARDVALDRLVAIQLLPPPLAASVAARDRVPPAARGAQPGGARGRARRAREWGSGGPARRGPGRTGGRAGGIFGGAADPGPPPRFRLWRGWWPRLPLLPLRIEPAWLSPES